MYRSETFLAIFLICRFADIANDGSVLSIGDLIAFVEQEAWEHGLFEAAEYQKERAGFNDSCDPARPAPAASVCNSSASDKSEAVTGLVCDVLT